MEVWYAQTNSVEEVDITFESESGYAPGKLLKVKTLKSNDPYLSPDSMTFSAYPNPATTNLLVNIPFSKGEEGTVHLMDVSGMVVWSTEFNATQETMELNVSGLEAGIYVLEIQINAEDQQWLERKRIAIAD